MSNILQPNEVHEEVEGNGFHGGDPYKDTPLNAEIERLVAKLDTFRKGEQQQTILITSAVPGEGKSTVAAHLAKCTARNSKRPTLLIDFDIRRPRMHKLFAVSKDNGVIDILKGEFSFRDCFKPTSIPNLVILTSGKADINPIKLLTSNRIKIFFNEIESHFGIVIVDSPPAIPVSDPLILGKLVDSVLFVIRAGSTSRLMIKRALDMFHDVNVNIDGIILNNIENVLPHYYDYYGYQYYEQGQSNED